MIKSFATVVDSPTIATPFLRHLLEEARKRAARTAVTVLTTSPILFPKLAPFGSVYLPPAALSEDCDEAIDFTLRALGGPAADLGVSGVHGDLTLLARNLGKSGEIADLFVIGPQSSWDIPWLRRNVIESLLVGSGTPLMLLPDEARLPAFQRIAFGWQPSAEAVRMAHDLVALAEPGAKIDIVTVGDEDENSRAAGYEPIVDFFSRHGFNATSHLVDDRGPVDEQLQSFATAISADLLAIGGFGHSRLREIALGGVTHALLDRHRLPILMAH